MKITATRVFDVFELLCHDSAQQEAADLPFDEFDLQEAINEKLEILCKGRIENNEWIQVASPEDTGLDRFTVAYYADRYQDEEPKIFNHKFRSSEEVKKILPPKVVDILELLNKESLVL